MHREALALHTIFATPQGFRGRVDVQIDPETKSIDFRSRSLFGLFGLFGLFDFGKNRSRIQAFTRRFQVAA